MEYKKEIKEGRYNKQEDEKDAWDEEENNEEYNRIGHAKNTRKRKLTTSSDEDSDTNSSVNNDISDNVDIRFINKDKNKQENVNNKKKMKKSITLKRKEINPFAIRSEKDINPIMPKNIYFLSEDKIMQWETSIENAREIIEDYLLSKLPMIDVKDVSGVISSCFQCDYLSLEYLEKVIKNLTIKNTMGLVNLHVDYSFCQFSKSGYKWIISYYIGHIDDD